MTDLTDMVASIVSDYNRGYEQGKKDAVVHAHWINECDEHFCSNCDACLEDILQLKFTSHAEENYSLSAEEYGDKPFYIVEFDEEKLPKFCPDCGSIMDEKEK